MKNKTNLSSFSYRESGFKKKDRPANQLDFQEEQFNEWMNITRRKPRGKSEWSIRPPQMESERNDMDMTVIDNTRTHMMV